jgi:hypothetical protein
MFDNFELSDSARDGDTVLLGLFRQWQAAMRPLAGWPLDDDLSDDVMDRVIEIERQIYAAPAVGVVGLGIKAFMAARASGHRGAADPCGLGFSEGNYGATGDRLDEAAISFKGLIEDVARMVPEIAPLAAEMIGAPMMIAPEGELIVGDGDQRLIRDDELRQRAEALAAEYSGPLPPGDAGLIEAERRRREVLSGEAALYREFEPSMQTEKQIIEPTTRAREDELWEFINEAEPEGLAGVAVKLRCLRERDPDGGEGAILAQCIAAIERVIAAAG